ncbi:MAG: hypothetical protein WKF96_19855 [Solirubrobacteraceae bacterium]
MSVVVESPPFREALRGLRRRRDEAQLTQFVAAVASTDRRFAGRLASILVRNAPERQNFEPPVGEAFEVPADLICRPEERVWDTSGVSQGFVDLLFRTDDRSFVLLAELKLHSGYGRDQVNRYLRGLDIYRQATAQGGRSGLIAVTRNPPVYGEPEAARPGWVGSVRWAAIIDELRTLEHQDKSVEALWRATLTILDEQGDFGMSRIDIDDVKAWARYTKGRHQLIRLMEEISEPAITTVRDAFAEHPDRCPDQQVAHLVRRGKHGRSVVFPGQERVHVRIAIHDLYRLRIQFRPGPAGPRFMVEARHPDAATLPHPVQVNLRRVGERLRNEWQLDDVTQLTDSRTYWRLPHPPEAWLGDGGPEVADRLHRLLRQDVRTLVATGIFSEADGLCFDAGSKEAPAEEEEDVLNDGPLDELEDGEPT